MGVHGRRSVLRPEWESSGSTTGLHTSSAPRAKATAVTSRHGHDPYKQSCAISCVELSQHRVPGAYSQAMMLCVRQCQHLLSVRLQSPELSCERMQVLPIFNMSLPRYNSHFGSFGRGAADGYADCLHW